MKRRNCGSIAIVVCTGAWVSSASGGPPPSSLAETAGASPVDADYVSFPGGRRIHKSCVHSMPDGSRIEANGDVVLDTPTRQTVEHVEPCRHAPLFKGDRQDSADPSPTSHMPIGNGNIELVYAHPTSSTWFDALASQVVVPPPANNFFGESEVFLWSGLVSRNSNNLVIQPVLQWGVAASGCSAGGNRFEMQVYYIDVNGNGYCGSAQTVSPGETITEYVVAEAPCDNSGVNCNWLIAYVRNNVTYGNTTGPVPVKLDTAIFQSLEAYNIPDCSFFPSAKSTGFITDWYEPAPNWNSYNQTSTISIGVQQPTFDQGINVTTQCPYGVSGTTIGAQFLGFLSY
jgi:hypothetical protein